MSNTVPKGWCRLNLPDVCYFQEGPGLRNWQYTTSGYPFINIRCIKDGYLDLSNVQYISSDEANQKYKHFFLNEGDYVLSSSGTLGRMAKIRKKDLPLMLNTSVIRFRSSDDKTLYHDYLPHYLQSQVFVNQIAEESQGSAQVNFGPTHLKLVECTLPPVPEQQKIAAILSSVDDVIEKTRAQIDKLKDLKTGIMQELLTKGIGSDGVPHTEFKDSPVGRIPVSWRVAKLAQVTKVVDSLHQTPTFANDGFPMIRVSDIKPGKVNTERAFKVSQEVFNQFTKNHKPQKSDLLMSRVGSYGVCCYLNRDIDVCLGQNTVVIIPDRIDSLFLYHSIYSEAVQNQIEFEVAGSGYKSLSLASIRSLSIPLPPDDEQKQIADILVSIDDQIEVKNRKLKAVSNAKKALMQDLLTGKVRVNIDQKESAVA